MVRQRNNSLHVARRNVLHLDAVIADGLKMRRDSQIESDLARKSFVRNLSKVRNCYCIVENDVRQPLSILKAILQSSLGKLTVDRDARIVRGVKLLENNRDVTYKGADGKPAGFRTNEALLSGLIAHAGNRSIPSHLSHDWTEGKRDALHDRIGAIKSCRLSDASDLIGDAHIAPGIEGDRILWLAEHDPEHAMLSIVFDWNPIKSDGVTYAVPLNFESADFVAKGAGVTAMLSAIPNDMTKEEVQAIAAESVKAALADFTPKLPDNLITADESDKRIKAALAEYKPKLSDEDRASIKTEAEASFTAKLGAGPLQLNLSANKATDAYTAKLAEYKKLAPNTATAISRLLHDHPELRSAHEEQTEIAVAKLTR